MMTMSAAFGSIHEYQIDQPSLCSPASLSRSTNHKGNPIISVDRSRDAPRGQGVRFSFCEAASMSDRFVIDCSTLGRARPGSAAQCTAQKPP
jgi:hypothetical protein